MDLYLQEFTVCACLYYIMWAWCNRFYLAHTQHFRHKINFCLLSSFFLITLKLTELYVQLCATMLRLFYDPLIFIRHFMCT